METTSTVQLSEIQELPSGNAIPLAHAVHLHTQSQSLETEIESNFMSKPATPPQISIVIFERANQN